MELDEQGMEEEHGIGGGAVVITEEGEKELDEQGMERSCCHSCCCSNSGGAGGSMKRFNENKIGRKKIRFDFHRISNNKQTNYSLIWQHLISEFSTVVPVIEHLLYIAILIDMEASKRD
ncbi:hypothetical protein CHS0354_041310 [Potamilus streckersoni]|uniref:Uncharacterized protein n=1 Tax=Potamilus streckersoni TaxID=2493646 RepID=A0AAE0SEK1_9BIVA|nr:hypothetical protein CHS0354_041310 [Potamilus streckersoni]